MLIQAKYTEELLGSQPTKEVWEKYLATNAPTVATKTEEAAALISEEDLEKAETNITRFHRDTKDNPVLFDYQIKGFFKDACGALARVPGTLSNDLSAYRKVITGCVFVFPRVISLTMPTDGKISNCIRPIIRSGIGEPTAIANSETVPVGTTFQIEVLGLDQKKHDPIIREWLCYGLLRGIGQWRNSGKGRFVWKQLPEPGPVEQAYRKGGIAAIYNQLIPTELTEEYKQEVEAKN